MSASATRLRHLARLLADGGIVAHPTEGVFGLGCDPLCASALARVIALKRRDRDKGLIVLGARVSHFAGLADARDLARLPVPAPGARATTYVLRAGPLASAQLTGGRATLAVRVCALPVTAALCERFGRAIVSTSANHSGRPPLRDALAARLRFGTGLDGVLCAPVGGAGRPSRVVDLHSGCVLRP